MKTFFSFSSKRSCSLILSSSRTLTVQDADADTFFR